MTTIASLKNPGFSPPADEMARLCRAGFSLLPLGGGKDGKSPLLAFKGKPKISLSRVLGPMHSKGSACYGIRLDGLVVIDCDEDDPNLIRDLEARFGPSPVHVRTPRGWHLYYRDTGHHPNLRGEGLAVDVKSGASQYVVGPCSIRPDGGAYKPHTGFLGEVSLPLLRNKESGSVRAHVGQRNAFLTREAIAMVEMVDCRDELLGNLTFIRDEECQHPATVSDRELEKITDWAWGKRLGNSVYAGRDSELRMSRLALDRLKAMPNASDAIAL